MTNLISQDLIVKAGNQDQTKNTEQLQIKYARLKHPLMQRNFLLKMDHATLFFFNSHTMMLSDLP